MSGSISDCYYMHGNKLGEGGFAKVKLATHLATNQYVAIKCVDKIKIGSELPRIYNEIECLKKLRHANIARLLQVFETESTIFLVLEYCAGGELFDYIVSKERLNEDEAALIIHDLMRVLEFIHLNGFAHRDLKPENVLFDDKHKIKLIDFGLAANCSTNPSVSLEHLSTCCGSVTYAAPELIAGNQYSGTQVDVWSAGVILYAILIGQLPFNETKVSKLYTLIQAGIKELPDFLSSDANDLIRRMLTVDPANRITVREILFHPWIKARSQIFERRRNQAAALEVNQAFEHRVMYRCLETFPDLSLNALREYIRQDFNYYSTAYHLLRAKHVEPRIHGAKRRLMSDFDSSYDEAISSSAKRPVLAPINEAQSNQVKTCKSNEENIACKGTVTTDISSQFRPMQTDDYQQPLETNIDDDKADDARACANSEQTDGKNIVKNVVQNINNNNFDNFIQNQFAQKFSANINDSADKNNGGTPGPVMIVNHHNSSSTNSRQTPSTPAAMRYRHRPIATPVRRPLTTPGKRAALTQVMAFHNHHYRGTPGPERIVPVLPYICHNNQRSRLIEEPTPKKSIIKRLLESATPSRKQKDHVRKMIV